MNTIKKQLFLFLFLLCISLTGCSDEQSVTAPYNNTSSKTESSTDSFTAWSIPDFDQQPYVIVNNNLPDFSEKDYTTEAFEHYGELDALGRCGIAYANICKELMPTEKRGEIGPIRPSGWKTTKYDSVEGKYLYNRCHLIGFQLAGENANEKNLITGTRYMNVDGMLPFENMVADYVKDTGNHVLYRVTPKYEGDNLVADGVFMEGWSVEDAGDGICFHVFVYNVQPGITIDYKNGNNHADSDSHQTAHTSTAEYILNTNSKKFHTPDCSGVKQIKEENIAAFSGDRQDLIDDGYTPCGRCQP